MLGLGLGLRLTFSVYRWSNYCVRIKSRGGGVTSNIGVRDVPLDIQGKFSRSSILTQGI